MSKIKPFAVRDFVFEGRVYFGDTDAAGVVYHGRYIYWMEAARIDMLDELGCSYQSLQDQHIGLLPVDVHIRYKKPLRFGDQFRIVSSFTEVKSASLVVRNFVEHGGERIVEGQVKLGCVDERTWKPMRIPRQLLDVIV